MIQILILFICNMENKPYCCLLLRCILTRNIQSQHNKQWVKAKVHSVDKTSETVGSFKGAV